MKWWHFIFLLFGVGGWGLWLLGEWRHVEIDTQLRRQTQSAVDSVMLEIEASELREQEHLVTIHELLALIEEEKNHSDEIQIRYVDRGDVGRIDDAQHIRELSGHIARLDSTLRAYRAFKIDTVRQPSIPID